MSMQNELSPDFICHPLIMLQAGLRPAWEESNVRGHLALRHGALPPAPPWMSGWQILSLAVSMVRVVQ